jgi:hypothetical protein
MIFLCEMKRSKKRSRVNRFRDRKWPIVWRKHQLEVGTERPVIVQLPQQLKSDMLATEKVASG